MKPLIDAARRERLAAWCSARRRRGATGKAIETAAALRVEGRHDEAIELLTAAHRERHDPELAIELVNIRHEAFTVRHHPTGRPTWPPVADDQVGPSSGLVETDRGGFNASSLASAIVHHGSLIVRNFITPEQVAVLVDDIDRSSQAYQDRNRLKSAVRGDGWYRPFTGFPATGLRAWDRDFTRDGRSTCAADSPNSFVDVVDIARASGAVDVIEEFFGERPALSVLKTTLRKVAPDSGTAWHQDGAFLGRDIRSVNMWIALSDCGVDAPSLDLVAARLHDIVETGTAGSPFDWAVGDAVAEHAAGDAAIVRPVFAPGDAIFFDHLNLHRTGVGPGMTRERYALEAWFFAPSTYPMDRLPLVV